MPSAICLALPLAFLFEGVDQFDGGEEADLAAVMLDGLDAEGGRDMGFARSGTADQDNILRAVHALTAMQGPDGDRGAIHGRISKQGNAVARTMLIEAAWSAASVPGPLRAFFLRIKDRKGLNVAAVATARKIAWLIWQLLTKEAPYRWARPAFVAMKIRKLELRAGAARAHGPAGPGRDYWIKQIRHREMELVA